MVFHCSSIKLINLLQLYFLMYVSRNCSLIFFNWKKYAYLHLCLVWIFNIIFNWGKKFWIDNIILGWEIRSIWNEEHYLSNNNLSRYSLSISLKCDKNTHEYVQNVPQSWWFFKMFLSIQDTEDTSFLQLWACLLQGES